MEQRAERSEKTGVWGKVLISIRNVSIQLIPSEASRGGETERAKTITVDFAGPFNIGAQRFSFLVNKRPIFSSYIP
jgi:hypothetical protein